MKTGIFFLILCALAFPAYSAEEPEFSAARVEALVAALPTSGEIAEWYAWYHKSESMRRDLDPELTAKVKDSDAHYKELFTQIKVGKSILDYPGILSLGTMTWDAAAKTYTFHVKATMTDEFGIAGFTCVISVDGKIMKKKRVIWWS